VCTPTNARHVAHVSHTCPPWACAPTAARVIQLQRARVLLKTTARGGVTSHHANTFLSLTSSLTRTHTHTHTDTPPPGQTSGDDGHRARGAVPQRRERGAGAARGVQPRRAVPRPRPRGARPARGRGGVVACWLHVVALPGVSDVGYMLVTRNILAVIKWCFVTMRPTRVRWLYSRVSLDLLHGHHLRLRHSRLSSIEACFDRKVT
jgi:hypothetical protein